MVGFNSGDLKLWGVHDMKLSNTIKNVHDAGINCVKFMPNGTQIVSMSKDATIKVTDLRMLKTIITMEHSDLSIRGRNS